jgi:hypothetical protein
MERDILWFTRTGKTRLQRPGCLLLVSSCAVDLEIEGAFVPDNGFKSVCQMKWVYSLVASPNLIPTSIVLILILITHL